MPRSRVGSRFTGRVLAGRPSLAWAFIDGVVRCARTVLCLVTSSTNMPIGAAGGEDARTLVPGHADASRGTSSCSPTRRWLKIEQGTLEPHIPGTVYKMSNPDPVPGRGLLPPVVQGAGYSMRGCGLPLFVDGRHDHSLANRVHHGVEPP